MSPVEQFIRDLGRYHRPPRLSKNGRLVVMRRQDDAADRELAVEVTQLDGTDGGPWPDQPPKKICYSAGVEPVQPRDIQPLSGKQAHTPDEHWDRYNIDLSPAWAPDVEHKPNAFLKVAMELLEEA